MRRNAARQPNIASHNTVMTYSCITTQDSRTSIDNNMVFNGRMSFLLGVSFIYTECSESYPLIDFYMISNNCCFPDDNTRAMVNTKMCANMGARMNMKPTF